MASTRARQRMRQIDYWPGFVDALSTMLLVMIFLLSVFMLAQFLRGKNWSRWGNDIEHINHWSAFGFKKFVGKHIRITAFKVPFFWTLLVGVKN